MKIKKYVGLTALVLGVGILNPSTSAFAATPITNENYIIESDDFSITDLENYDKASAAELKAYDEAENLESSNVSLFNKETNLDHLKENFGNEYELRLALAKSIKTLELLDSENTSDLRNRALEILNSDDLDQIAKEDLILKTYIIEQTDEINKDGSKEVKTLSPEDEDKLKRETQAFIKDGILFESEYIKKDQNFDKLKKAVLNSRAYYQANDEIKDLYNKLISDLEINASNTDFAFDTLLDFIKSSDKGSFNYELESISSPLLNVNFNASNDTDLNNQGESLVETTTIENDSLVAEESAASQSAFLSNDKTSTKYNELTDPQKRELDAIDTDKNGILSDEELDSSANYTSNIQSDSWLYPFTEKGQADDKSTNENQSSQDSSKDTTRGSTDTDKESDAAKPESNNPSNGQIPQTVTIDSGTKSPQLSSDTDDKTDDTEKAEETTGQDDSSDNYDDDTWSESVASSNTEAATIVKTGIKGLGIVAIVLVIAIIAYGILNKDKFKK